MMTLEQSIHVELTPREEQVAALAARGFTSRYVARKLQLSARTIETHLRHIYEKFNIESRDELIELRGWFV